MFYFYLLIFLTLFLAIFIKTREKQGAAVYLFIMFLIIGLLMCFRNKEVGNDTTTYLRFFRNILETTDFKAFVETNRFEKGFIYFTALLTKISTDRQILLIVSGIIVCISFGRFFYKYSELPWLSVYMFLTLQFFDLSMSGLRQILAISILLFSYDFLIQKRFWPFLFICLLAASFHTSAIVFIVLFPLVYFKPGRFFYLFTAAFGLFGAVFFGRFLNVIFGVFPQYMQYFLGDGRSFTNQPTLAGALMLALFTVLIIISVFCRGGINKGKQPVLSEHNKGEIVQSFSDKDDIMLISIWLGIIMLLLSMNASILNRFKYVFAAPIMVYYPNSIMRLKNESSRMFLIAGSCLVFFAYIFIIYTLRPEWQSTFPYAFYWQE